MDSSISVCTGEAVPSDTNDDNLRLYFVETGVYHT